MSSKDKTSIISVIQSVLSAAFGVQKRKNLERDFSEGKPAHFIIAGLIGTLLFIILLAGLVSVITPSACLTGQDLLMTYPEYSDSDNQ